MELKDIIIISLVIAGMIAVEIAILIRGRLKKAREKQLLQEYREKYVQEIMFGDARFGVLTGEYDLCKHTLLADNLELPAFGSSQPFLITADDYTPDRNAAILRALAIAYDSTQDIFRGLAEVVRQEMQFDMDADEIPSSEEIIAMIIITDFQFVFDAEMPVMQVIGGADYETERSVIPFGLNAMYRINEKTWEYDAERIGA